MLSNQEIELIRKFNRRYVLALGVLSKQIFNTDLSWAEGRILEEIGQRQPIEVTPMLIANALKIDKSYTSRIIKKLTKIGLVVKRPSVLDARSVYLELTPKGQEVFRQIDQRSSLQIQAFISGLSASEQRQFFNGIAEVNRLLFEQGAKKCGK